MKKTFLIIAILSLTIAGCNDEKKQTDSVLNNNWEKEIKLDDNEAKWEANIETTKGVEDLQNLIKTNTTTTVEEYVALAEKLNERKNILVKEFTMEGPSHDNLHIFLYPLIGKINLLLEVTSTEKASEIMSSISDNLTAYNTYFK
jgi:hypothetical protein